MQEKEAISTNPVHYAFIDIIEIAHTRSFAARCSVCRRDAINSPIRRAHGHERESGQLT